MTLLGHEDAWRAWHTATSGERMHHAWLLAGRAGLGKMQFAYAAARELVGAPPESENHPDIMVLTYGPKDDKEDRKRSDGKPFELARSIRIGQVRSMQRRLTTRPTMGDRRVVVIDPADDMEHNAANALLKSLEEPPQGTYFLLVSHRPAKLLPTIRSRCRTLRFHALDDQDLEHILTRLAPEADPATREAAIAAAGGSPGAALAFVSLRLGEIAALMRRITQEGDPGFVLRGELAGAIGARPDRERLRAVLDLARSVTTEGLEELPPEQLPIRAQAHEELVRLTAEMPTYNYDAGLMVMEIGTLLARSAQASERANG